MILPKIVVGGPRGNKCHGCGKKVKAPEHLVKITEDFNRYAKTEIIKNYCLECAKPKVEEALSSMAKLLVVLNSDKISSESLGTRKVKVL